MSTLRELVDDGEIHVLDGAVGTMLFNRGVFVNVCYDELNLSQSRMVRQIHEEYVRAGAEILETNTFGANPVKLSSWGLEEKTEEINRTAAALARAAGREGTSVVGAIGPLGIRIEPYGPTGVDEAEAYFVRQVLGLLEGGVDGFILETFGDLEELHQAHRAVRGLSDLPVIAQMTVAEDGETSYGTPVETIAAALDEWGADVVGLNCSVGPASILDAVERISAVTDRPLSALPNAGLPRLVGGRKMYISSPAYMAHYARRLVGAGVRFVGGCCGTTPEHIRKIREAVAGAHANTSPAARTAPSVRVETGRDRGTPVSLARRSRWGAKLAAGEPVTGVELVPPRGWEAGEILSATRRAQEAGVDAVIVTHGARDHSRMGIVPAAFLIERESGIETVIHYTCRDRNMLGMISDLLGGAAGGLRNLLIVTGDPPVMGPYQDSTAVFDIDSIGLTNVVRRLNRGVDPGGSSIGRRTEWVVGVSVNPSAVDMERELDRFRWKVEAGADFAVTQPLFDPGELERFLERSGASDLPLLARIRPLLSARDAEFMANEIPGVRVPESMIERMREAGAKGEGRAIEEGVRIARETLDGVGPMVGGAVVGAPRGRIDVALGVLR